MKPSREELLAQLSAARDLLEAMVAELRFRGLEEEHRLIRQARSLRDRIMRLKRPD